MNCKPRKIAYGFLLPTLICIRIKWNRLIENSAVKMCKSLIRDLIIESEVRFDPHFKITDNREIAAVAALTHPKFKTAWIQCLSSEAQERVKRLSKNLTKSNEEQPVDQPEKNYDFFDFTDSSPTAMMPSFTSQGAKKIM